VTLRARVRGGVPDPGQSGGRRQRKEESKGGGVHVQTLDLGGLGVGLGALLLRDDLATDDKLADVVRLVEVEEPTDLGRALRAEPLGEDLVGQPGDVVLALLDDDEVEGADVGTDDATADRLALALAGAAGAVARVALGEEEADTVRDEDSLLQRETLLLNSPNAPRRAPHFFHHRSSAHDSVQFPCIQPDPVRPLTVVGRPVVSRRESRAVESSRDG
jgi:hypothetical protein